MKIMEGVNFVTNDHNEKIAVMIDLNKYGELWEDFYDCMIADQRKDDGTISLEDFKSELKDEGKL